mmetsp:Transcript_48516/g.127913  ORF Transcript_48516/g.127913 Transcript_48516/m.127913 type:complete len:332 (-) Transcript_48516:112-1107(-)
MKYAMTPIAQQSAFSPNVSDIASSELAALTSFMPPPACSGLWQKSFRMPPVELASASLPPPPSPPAGESEELLFEEVAGRAQRPSTQERRPFLPCLLARPKSIIFKFMSSAELVGPTGSPKSQFSGLRSLCTSLCSWRWSTASTICSTSMAMLLSLKCSLFALRSVKLPPLQYSMTKYTLRASSQVSCSLHMCGWSNCLRVIISSFQPPPASLFFAICLKACTALVWRCRALITVPIELGLSTPSLPASDSKSCTLPPEGRPHLPLPALSPLRQLDLPLPGTSVSCAFCWAPQQLDTSTGSSREPECGSISSSLTQPSPFSLLRGSPPAHA